MDPYTNTVHASWTTLEAPAHQRGGFRYEELPEGVFEVDQFRGMINSIPKRMRDVSSFSELINFRNREGVVTIRPGSTYIAQPAPNSQPILKLVTFENESGAIFLVRLCDTSVHVDEGTGTFTTYTHPFSSTGQLFSSAQFIDQLYIANGVQRVMNVDFGGNVVTEIAGAPRARYLATFAERVIAANVTGAPYGIYWPVNADPTDWAGVGSGEENLVQGASSLGDDITGLWPLGDVLVILRQRSVWIAERRPSADNPFVFRKIIDRVGCDAPFGSCLIDNAIVFCNVAQEAVYMFSLGEGLKLINGDVKDGFFSGIQDLSYLELEWDVQEKELLVKVPNVSGSRYSTKMWVWNALSGAWSYDAMPAFVTLASAGSGTNSSNMRIDDLIGNIDGLLGSIDSLGNISGESQLFESMYFGMPDGNIISYDYGAVSDAGVPITATAISQDMGKRATRRTVQDLGWEVRVTDAASVSLSQSRDAETWKNVKTVGAFLSTRKLLLPKTRITGDELYWKLEATGGILSLVSWWGRILEKGPKR